MIYTNKKIRNRLKVEDRPDVARIEDRLEARFHVLPISTGVSGPAQALWFHVFLLTAAWVVQKER